MLFVLAIGLFTLSIGDQYPCLGYISFDRVARASSILMLGPVDAAWLNGLASLLYAWHRPRRGASLRAVCNASLMIFAAGWLYKAAPTPASTAPSTSAATAS